jgi:hypothetical protein
MNKKHLSNPLDEPDDKYSKTPQAGKQHKRRVRDDDDDVVILTSQEAARSWGLKKLIERYQSWELSIIPVKNRDKVPLVDWKPYQSLRSDHKKIKEWLFAYWAKGANIGIVCGSVSGNLVVIDFDTDSAWDGFLKCWKEHRPDDIYAVTPVVKTTRGHHVYLRCRQDVKQTKLASGIDIKAEGGFVVAPPSIGSTGSKYEFVNPDIDQILEIKDLSEVGIDTGASANAQRAPLDTANLLNGVPEGKRDETCFRLAARYKAKGLTYEETLAFLIAWADKCNPPFPHDQVKKCVTSAYNYKDKGILPPPQEPIVSEQPHEPRTLNQAEKLAKAKETVTKWLKLKDTNIIEVALATIVANKAQGDPVWLLIVGAPSTGRSEILRGLYNCSGVHALGGFTANTFASGLDKGPAGLLETLPAEITLVVKDFGTVLTMRHQEKSIVLQQLREIYDGEYKKEYGNGKVVHWKGRMGLLGAVTSSIEHYHGVIGELGNRYILYRAESAGKLRQDIASMALNDAGAEQQMREEISNAFKAALEDAPSADLVEIPEEIKPKLTALADLVSRLRSPVSRDSYRKTINYQPDIEGPARLVKALAKLGKGLSALRGSLTMTESEYEVVRIVARDTIPQMRATLIKHLLDREWHLLKDISYDLDIPPATLTILLEDLMLIGALIRKPVLEEGEELRQTTPNKWRLKKAIAALITQTGLLD